MLQTKIIQNDYKIVTIFHLFILFFLYSTRVRDLCLVFNPLSTVLSRLEVFFCSGRMRQTVNWSMEISRIDHDFEQWNAMRHWLAETLFNLRKIIPDFFRGLGAAVHKL